jgi:hypothetical protein
VGGARTRRTALPDTDRFVKGEFDAVVAYGGPLSYVFEDAPKALVGLLRVGGVVVASVMSTLGSWRSFLAGTTEVAAIIGQDATDLVIETGDLRHEGLDQAHVCQMYRHRELAELVPACGGTLLAESASNWASLNDEETLAAIAADPDHWRRFLDHEVRACRERGLLDAGTHILVAARSA